MLGGDPGLQLWVRGGVPKDGYIPMGEIASVREDMLCGSLRVVVRVVGGGGGGGRVLFGYVATLPTHLTPPTRWDGHVHGHFDSLLPYRFDWTPGKVVFFADGGVARGYERGGDGRGGACGAGALGGWGWGVECGAAWGCG